MKVYVLETWARKATNIMGFRNPSECAKVQAGSTTVLPTKEALLNTYIYYMKQRQAPLQEPFSSL